MSFASPGPSLSTKKIETKFVYNQKKTITRESRKAVDIDLYHAAAILSPMGTKSFVFACPASHWMRGWTGKIFCFSSA